MKITEIVHLILFNVKNVNLSKTMYVYNIRIWRMMDGWLAGCMMMMPDTFSEIVNMKKKKSGLQIRKKNSITQIYSFSFFAVALDLMCLSLETHGKLFTLNKFQMGCTILKCESVFVYIRLTKRGKKFFPEGDNNGHLFLFEK